MNSLAWEELTKQIVNLAYSFQIEKLFERLYEHPKFIAAPMYSTHRNDEWVLELAPGKIGTVITNSPQELYPYIKDKLWMKYDFTYYLVQMNEGGIFILTDNLMEGFTQRHLC